MTKAIEKAIRDDNWPRARALIRGALKCEPNSHWLITRLGLTYYEQRQYKRALHHSEKALTLSPKCPLVLWDYAGCLDMLDRTNEAISVYRRLVRRGVGRLARGECGEGKVWAKCMIADCHYSLAQCYRDIGNMRQAMASYRRYLTLRKSGYRSIYSVVKARNGLKSLMKENAQQAGAAYPPQGVGSADP